MKKKYLPTLLNENIWQKRSTLAENWFKNLKNLICKEFLKLENFYNEKNRFKKDILKKKNGIKIT